MLALMVIVAVTLPDPVIVARAEGGPARALPGNKACPYPPEAHRHQVAGPVHFGARVRPDGTVEFVTVDKVPLPTLGFEEAVRACVSEWRFDLAPPGEADERLYRGKVRFQIAPQEEDAIRTALKELIDALNTRDVKAMRRLEHPIPGPPGQHFTINNLDEFQAQLVSGFQLAKGPQWHIELGPELEYLWFARGDIAALRAPYERSAVLRGGTGDVAPMESGVLEARLVKGSHGWRFASVIRLQGDELLALRVGGPIPQPPLLTSVAPSYPDIARQARVQGDVILDCTLSPEGKVTHTRVLRGIPLLDQAALDAVKQWVFAPTVVDGIPVSVTITVKVPFKLRR